MINVAYTVGLTTSYDKSLREEDGPRKIGRRPVGDAGFPEGYQGGWVWKRASDAHAFLHTEAFRRAMPARRAEDFSVYMLDLPHGWDEDIYLWDQDDVHHLAEDAVIVKKVTLDVADLRLSLKDKFEWIESRDLRVGSVFLHPMEVEVLAKSLDFDRGVCRVVQEAFPGLIGYLWGAQVYESPIVPERHVVVIPEGIVAQLTDGCAAMAL